jgi:hypothetical protein
MDHQMMHHQMTIGIYQRMMPQQAQVTSGAATAMIRNTSLPVPAGSLPI